MRILLDEWVFHDARNENGKELRDLALRFILWLPTTEHQIVVVRDSKWHRKARALSSAGEPAVAKVGKVLNATILRSDERCLLLNEAECSAFVSLDPRVPADDQYLIRAYLAGRADIFVTSDLRLRDNLKGAEPTVNVAMRSVDGIPGIDM